jgi:hypothetical protein
MGKIETVGGEKFNKDFTLENFLEVESELDQFLFQLGFGFVSTFYGKTNPQDLTREEMKSVSDYAFKIVGSPALSRALRHVITAWENMNDTTLDNGEYMKELTAREGAD